MKIKQNVFLIRSTGFMILACWLTPLHLVGQIVSPTNLEPVADAYVQRGNNAGLNYGSASTLFVQSSGNAKNNYDTYFQFSLAGVDNVNSVKLLIKARLSANGTVATTVYDTATTWSESSITWNNKLSRGAALNSVSVSGISDAWYELDISGFVIQEMAAGRNLVSLCLHNIANSSQTIQFYSREATSANRPILVCAITNVPPAVAIAQPAANSVFTAPANITFAASASDSDGSIAQVSFYQGTTLLGTDTTAPYSLDWNNVGAGTYTLSAKQHSAACDRTTL